MKFRVKRGKKNGGGPGPIHEVEIVAQHLREKKCTELKLGVCMVGLIREVFST